MAKIAIDARFYGSGHTGLGRYTTNVLKYLPAYLKNHTLQILLRDAEYDNFPSGKNIVKVHSEIPHYSLSEQLQLPGIIKALDSDLLYTLHFNAPIFAKVPKIVTVHDLIKSHFTGSDTTTRAPWLYQLKRKGYNTVISRTLTSAQDIIVPTNSVKNDILATYSNIRPERIHAIPEAPDEIFRTHTNLSNLKNLRNLPPQYFLFVGNAYPHKNLEVLLKAMKSFPETKLVIVAKQSTFLQKSLAGFDQWQITILSDLNDSELKAVYERAQVLVTPSLMEGYGLVGLESLMVGTPVLASNIPVYREVYGNHVTYFDPYSVSDLVSKLKNLPTHSQKPLIKFESTWGDVAKSIAEVINARCTSL